MNGILTSQWGPFVIGDSAYLHPLSTIQKLKCIQYKDRRMFQCRVNAADSGPALNQHYVSDIDSRNLLNATFDN